MGRPKAFKSVEELEALIDDYFATDAYMGEGDNRQFVPTISGLALHLDITTATLRNYGKDEDFFSTIKRAKQRVELSLEQRLAGNNVAGSIFNLKNNFDWKDKTESDINAKVETKDTSALDAIKQLIESKSS